MTRTYDILLLLACALTACSEPTAVPPQVLIVTEEEEPPPPPPPPLPDVDGVTPLEDKNPDPTIVEVDLVARPNAVSLLPGEPTQVLNYNDQLPGPLLHARVGDRVIVHFTNALDEPTVVHWHGLRISDQMDGSPRIQTPVEPGETFTYDFVVPDAGTFWYHTHLHQIEQFERGLYGALVVHEAVPPLFSAERLIVVDDIRLDEDNQVSSFLTSGPDIGRGRVGNTLLVNGRVACSRISRTRAGGWCIATSPSTAKMG